MLEAELDVLPDVVLADDVLAEVVLAVVLAVVVLEALWVVLAVVEDMEPPADDEVGPNPPGPPHTSMQQAWLAVMLAVTAAIASNVREFREREEEEKLIRGSLAEALPDGVLAVRRSPSPRRWEPQKTKPEPRTPIARPCSGFVSVCPVFGPSHGARLFCEARLALG